MLSGAAIAVGLVIAALLLGRVLGTVRRGKHERPVSDASLRRSEARLRATLDASFDPILTMAGDGLIRSASRAVERVFGWPPDELVGRHVGVLLRAPRRSEHDADIARELESGWPPLLGGVRELLAARRDGGTFPCEIWVNPVEVPERDAPVFCAVLRDITERRRGENRLEQSATHLALANRELVDSSKALQDLVAKLERSNEDLDEFAYVASHDLKEPLRGIHNQARFVLEDYADVLDADGKGRLETMARLAQRLTDMIDALLGFSRLGRTALAMARTDLQDVVLGVVESLQLVLQERSVEVRIPERLPTLFCSGVLVGEVFRNLIENAAKYNDAEARIVEIGVKAGGLDPSAVRNPVVLYVRDNGIGIKDRHQEAVFRIFKRLNGRDHFGDGTGMGLTIVKKIVERHGGRVWIDSSLGAGTTFYFTLHEGAPVPALKARDERWSALAALPTPESEPTR